MNKKAFGIVVGALFAATPLISAAADSLPAPFEGNSILQAEGVVKSIDQAKHSVTVTDANGGEASFVVANASNLKQIHKGSAVHVRMVRTALVSPTSGATGAQSPAGNVSAEVVTLDHASGLLELKSSNGAVFHIKGSDPAKVGDLKPGMHVEVAYAPKASISVEPAAQ
jgi:hypothetical protein